MACYDWLAKSCNYLIGYQGCACDAGMLIGSSVGSGVVGHMIST